MPPSSDPLAPRLRPVAVLALLAAGAGAVPLQDEAPAAPGASSGDAPAGLPELAVTRPKAVYRDHAEALELLERWAAARPGAAVPVALGESAGGRRLLGLLVGRPPAPEGGTSLAARRTVLVVGGLDGRSLHGAEAALALTAELLADPDALPADLAFLCLPWANPDGLDAELAWLAGDGPGTGGRNGRALDEDLDGLVDEDGPDDLSGDGLVTHMLVPDPMGPWCRGSDGRFLVPAVDAAPGAPRYRLLREGRDDDGDGLANEDGPGGVRLDRNFPLGWRGPHAPSAPGPRPLSEPGSAALARVLDEHDVLAAVLLDGHGGTVERATQAGSHRAPDLAGTPVAVAAPTADLSPGHTDRVDALVALALGVRAEAMGAELLAPHQPLLLGGPLAWLDARGVPALRLSTWGPRLGLGRSASLTSATFRPERPRALPTELEDFCDPGCATARGSAWRAYLDGRRGGLGFVDWHPVELEGTGTVLVGGWEADGLVNPPEARLGLSVDLALAWKDAFLEALPRHVLVVEEARREGALVTLRARVERRGSLPTSFLADGPLALELGLPSSARLVAGPTALSWSPAEDAPPAATWLVHAEEPGALRLALVGEGGELEVREVRP